MGNKFEGIKEIIEVIGSVNKSENNLDNGITSDNGVDLNAMNKNELKKGAYYPPPELPPAPAIICEAPADVTNRPDLNDINQYLEEVGGGFHDVQETKNQTQENSEAQDALSQDIPTQEPPKDEE